VSADEPHRVEMYADAVMACAELVGHSGATTFEIGYLHDDVPSEKAAWYAHALFKGTRVIAQDHTSPTAAAIELAERILANGRCKCGRPVALSDCTDGCCRWHLAGKHWVPGCNAAPITMPSGARGDLAAMQTVYSEQVGNRAQRRAKKREQWPRAGPPS